jgi:hypothetical protein
MNTLRNLYTELNKIQSHTVGLYYNRYTSKYEPVIEIDDNTFCTIAIGSLLGLSTNYYSLDAEHQVIEFPTIYNGKHMNGTLQDFMHYPNEFNQWYNEHCK